MPDQPRRVLRLSGSDHRKFLQDLVTNDIDGLRDGLVYAALLTPQGKYLFDFFLIPAEEAILIDVAADRADALVQRLTMYRLRADVAIEQTDLHVTRGTGAVEPQICDGFAICLGKERSRRPPVGKDFGADRGIAFD